MDERSLQDHEERPPALRRRYYRAERIDRFLREEAWPQMAHAVLGQPISKAEREAILGLDPEVVE